MQKDLKALHNDLDDLSDPVGGISSDVVSAISNVQDVLKDLNGYGLISDDRYNSINGTLDTMKNNSSNLGDSLQDVSSDLSSLSGSGSSACSSTISVIFS